MLPPNPTIILSRTDNLGDVMLTLPLAGIIKQNLPGARVVFLGKAYTRPLIDACAYIDAFLDKDAMLAQPELLKAQRAHAILHVFPVRHIANLAKQAGIPLRIGTSHRVYHWFTCNQLLHFGRKKSELHEAQLNAKLLAPLGLRTDWSLPELGSLLGFTRVSPLLPHLASLLQAGKQNVILHPKSKGSARDWPLVHYEDLVKLLPSNRYHFFVTGTEAEGALIRQQQPTLLQQPHVTDVTGKLSLGELVSFIHACNGLVACSTGPLHIAAALGKNAMGLYPPIRPMHPGRWAPLGPKVTVLVQSKTCSNCRKGGACQCIIDLLPSQAAQVVLGWV